MWFGTWLGGLNRYDGYTFKVYKHDDQDERSLGSNSIWALHVDRTGVLWVGTNEGVDRYDRDMDSFVHYHHRPDDPTSLPGYQARSLIEDESGALWAVTSGGLSTSQRRKGSEFRRRRACLSHIWPGPCRTICGTSGRSGHEYSIRERTHPAAQPGLVCRRSWQSRTASVGEC